MNPFRSIFAFGLFLSMVASPAIALEVTTVTLKAQASVPGDSIALSDVAEIDGPEVARFSPLVVHRLTGESASVEAETIRQMLMKLPEINPAFLSVKGYSRCRITRGQDVDAAVLPVAQAPSGDDASPGDGDGDDESWVNRTHAYFQSLTGWPSQELRVTIVGSNPPSLRIPAGGRIEFEPQATTFPGRCPLTVRVYEGSQIRQTFRLQADVARICRALVATQTIGRGQMVSADRLESRQVVLTVPGQPLTEMSQAVGQMSRTVIRPGVTLLAEHLQSPYLVRRGDWVTVRCLSGDLVVTITARAMSDAAAEQTIEARNESSRQNITVRVVGPKEAILVGTAVADKSSTPRESDR